MCLALHQRRKWTIIVMTSAISLLSESDPNAGREQQESVIKILSLNSTQNYKIIRHRNGANTSGVGSVFISRLIKLHSRDNGVIQPILT